MDRTERRDAFRSIVDAGPPPGLLAYRAGQAVGWCAVGPRLAAARFHAAKASRPEADLDAPDPQRIHAITCFFMRAGHRRQGLMTLLARAAVDYAKAHDALAVDACPIDPEKPLMWGEGFVGITSVFAALGFQEIARRSPRRPLMRLRLS